MVLGIADVGAIAGIVGILVSPLYILLIWLIRSYSSINREIGELTKDVQQNTKQIGEMKGSVDKLVDVWSGWVQKEK